MQKVAAFKQKTDSLYGFYNSIIIIMIIISCISTTRFVFLLITVVPHITNAIQDWVERVAHTPVDGHVPDVCVIEVSPYKLC